MVRHVLPALLIVVCLQLIASGPAAAGEPKLPPPFAGYELIEVTYLLRAPDGSTLRVSRRPAGDGTWTMARGLDGWGEARALPAASLQGWLGRQLLRSPSAYEQVGDYVRESWAIIQRLLDFLGVLILLTGSWAIWFLVRPALPGVSERAAFLGAFALVAGLWLYATQLYLSVVYALGLIWLPALAIGLTSWVLRRSWAAWTARGDAAAGS